jgi:predicted metalloprotease
MARRLTILLAICALAVTASGCGSGDSDRLAQKVHAQAEQVQQRAEKLRDRARELADQVREALDKIRRSVPRARTDAQAPATGARTDPDRIDAYLTEVIHSVDDYWTKTLRASDLPAPRVAYVWIPQGRAVRTGCGATAGADAAFYCPADDTIYVSKTLAAKIWAGVADNFPGQRAGYGHAVGDFGLAYVVAHEYAHNVQQELGLAEADPRAGVEPLELQADCMAGLWGNSVYRAGRLHRGDVQEAIDTAMAVGDFDLTNPQHHGTPEQRRAAWLLGYRSGDPGACTRAGNV